MKIELLNEPFIKMLNFFLTSILNNKSFETMNENCVVPAFVVVVFYDFYPNRRIHPTKDSSSTTDYRIHL